MKRPFFLIAVAALACEGALAARASIELLPQVEVAGEVVSLGQVARLRSPELTLMRQLVDLPIGRVPRDGQPVSVQRELLAQWIQRQTGLGPADLAWQGSEAARVIRATRVLKGAEIADAAMQALRDWMAQRGIAGEVRAARWPADVAIPAGEVQLRTRPLDASAARKRMLVWVDVWSEDVFLRTIPVALEVEAALPAGAAAPMASAVMPLHAPATMSRVLVERGAWATLRSNDGAVSLESRVAVLQDGRAGDHVRVRAAGGGGIFFARVVGPAQLELAP